MYSDLGCELFATHGRGYSYKHDFPIYGEFPLLLFNFTLLSVDLPLEDHAEAGGVIADLHVVSHPHLLVYNNKI